MNTDLQERLSERLHAEAARLIPDDAVTRRLPARSRRWPPARLMSESRWRAPALAAAAVVAIAAVTTVVVAQRHDGTASPAAGSATSTARTQDPHLSPIMDRPAQAFDCMGAQTGHAARTGVATIGITSGRFCLTVVPQSHRVAGTNLLASGPLRGWVMTEAVLAGAVASSVDGVAWLPRASADATGSAVDLYSLGTVRGFAFHVSSGGTLVLYSGQTVVRREAVPSPVGGGGPIAASSSQAATYPAEPAAGSPDGSQPASGPLAGETAPAVRSYPPGEGPSPKPGAWPTNARGQTYGSASEANAQTGEPDLIAAIATNGRHGYVLAAELSGPLATSLSQAAALNSAPSRTIPVYESDGITQVGVFEVQGR